LHAREEAAKAQERMVGMLRRTKVRATRGVLERGTNGVSPTTTCGQKHSNPDNFSYNYEIGTFEHDSDSGFTDKATDWGLHTTSRH